MIKKILFLVLLCSCTIALAQNNTTDILYLKNGSIIRGTIIEQIPFQTIKIQTSGGSIFVYKTEECESIEKEKARVNIEYDNESILNEQAEAARIKRNIVPAKFSKKCYFSSILDFNFYLGLSDFDKIYFKENKKSTFIMSIHTINGVQFLKNFFVGIGTGFNYHPSDPIISAYNGAQISIPIYLDTRWYITNNKTQPFINISGGFILPYSYIAKKTDINGNTDKYYYFFNPSIGVKTNISSRSSLNFSIGYSLYFTKVKLYTPGYYRYYDNNDYYSHEVINYVHGINLKIGFTF